MPIPPASGDPAPSAVPAEAPSAAGSPANAVVPLPLLGASIRPLSAGKIEDAEKEAAVRGAGSVIKLHRQRELAQVQTVADARRQVALRDAAEFGLRGLVSTKDPPDDEPHTSVEETEIGPREFLLSDRASAHVHVYVWRRSPAGGWVWADCRADSLEDLPRVRQACLTLTVTR